MAIEVIEKIEGLSWQTGDQGSLSIRYCIAGTTSEAAALLAMAEIVPSIFHGLFLNSLSIDSFSNDIWEGTAKYSRKESQQDPKDPENNPENQAPTISFDTGGGTQKIKRGHRTVQSVSVGSVNGQPYTKPDLKDGIAWNGQDFDGAEIVVPKWNFAETHSFAGSSVTYTYLGKLFALTGKVNQQAFRYLKPWECLFLGCSGTHKGPNSPCEITFKFAGEPEKKGLRIGDLPPVDKRGWDILSVLYADVTNANQIVKQPVAVDVIEVYEEGDFSQLGIGT